MANCHRATDRYDNRATGWCSRTVASHELVQHYYRAIELAGGYTLWQDFPQKPGEILNYTGKCEKYVVTSPQIRFFVDEEMQKK